VKADSIDIRVTGWINFAFSMVVNYYQLITLVEDNANVLNASGLVTIALVFLVLVITLGQPNFLSLKKVVLNLKRTRCNLKNDPQIEIIQQKRLPKAIEKQPNLERC